MGIVSWDNKKLYVLPKLDYRQNQKVSFLNLKPISHRTQISKPFNLSIMPYQHQNTAMYDPYDTFHFINNLIIN